MDTDRARAHALIDNLVGTPDPAADRAVEVLHAHAAALTWVRRSLGETSDEAVMQRLERTAQRLRTGEDDRDPSTVLKQVAKDALANQGAHSVA